MQRKEVSSDSEHDTCQTFIISNLITKLTDGNHQFSVHLLAYFQAKASRERQSHPFLLPLLHMHTHISTNMCENSDIFLSQQ